MWTIETIKSLVSRSKIINERIEVVNVICRRIM